jgi:hypothetical protein
MQIRKKGGMKFKKKYSPQKPVGQLQPNFCGMILGWPPSKIVSGDPIIGQNRQKFKVHNLFFYF